MRIITRNLFNTVTGAYAEALHRVSRDGRSPFPLLVNCILTYACNMDCPFCIAQSGRLQSPASQMTAQNWEEILRQIPTWTLLNFTGGEIFCHPQMYEILRGASRRNRIVTVTNGLAFDAASVSRFVTLGARSPFHPGLLQIGISINEEIDGPGRSESVLDEKIRIIERLAAEREKQGKRLPHLDLKVLIRDETAPYLPVFAERLRSSSVDSITFQMLMSNFFFCYLGLDPRDRERVDSLRGYKDERPDPIPFTQIDALRNSFSQLAKLPRSLQKRINLLPPIGASAFLDYYAGHLDLTGFHCTNPWMQVMIDPNGVAYQCFNPEGVDLKEMRFREAWNDPRMRAFRCELRERAMFNRCYGCCFLKAP